MLNGIERPEDRQLVSRLEDLIDSALYDGTDCFSDFLDARQLCVANAVAGKRGFSNCCVFGGFENAERSMICFSGGRNREMPFPIVCLEFSQRNEKTLTHRDYLGALMSVGIKREKIGDIRIVERGAFAAVADSVSGFVASSLDSVGSVSVKVSLHPDFPQTAAVRMEEIKGTVASLRLDCVLSEAMNISREKSCEYIRRKEVKLNCKIALDADEKLGEGDIFSVRGYGKYSLGAVGELTRKGRIKIIINKYI